MFRLCKAVTTRQYASFIYKENYIAVTILIIINLFLVRINIGIKFI